MLVSSTPVHQPGDTAWLRRWNGPGKNDERPSVVLIDSHGNTIVTGFTFTKVTDFNFVTLKYDSSGRLLWTRTYNSPLNTEDRIWAACLDARDNIYVTGGSIASEADNWDYLTIKYSPSGDTAWMRRYDSPFHGEDKPSAIAVDDSGNVYITGSSRGGHRYWDYLTIKYDARGDTVWTARYEGPAGYDDQAASLVVDRDHDVIVAGRSADEDRIPEITTVKYDRSGHLLWNQTYRGTGDGTNSASRVLADSAGNIYVCGTVSAEGAMYDYALIKYRRDGTWFWTRTYDGPGHRIDNANAMCFDPQGNIIVTGQSMGDQTFSDYATIKYRPDGETLWVRRYDGPRHLEDRGLAVTTDETGNVFVTGGSIQSGPYESYLTAEYNSAGALLWTRSYSFAGAGNSRALAIATRYGRVAITGYSINENADLDIVTISYRK